MSQIATTIEQSKKLLGAGLKQESCDMEWVNVEVWDGEQKRMAGKWVLNAEPCVLVGSSNYVPAWSLSKLWDINNDSGLAPHNYGGDDFDSTKLIETLVRWIMEGLADGEIADEYLALPH